MKTLLRNGQKEQLKDRTTKKCGHLEESITRVLQMFSLRESVIPQRYEDSWSHSVILYILHIVNVF